MLGTVAAAVLCMAIDVGHCESRYVGTPEVSDAPVSGANDRFHSLALPVHYDAAPPYALANEFASFGLLRGGTPPPKRSITLCCEDPRMDATEFATTHRPSETSELRRIDVRSQIRRGDTPGTFVLEMDLGRLPPGTNGSFRGEVHIETGDPRQPTLVVRYSGVCRE